MTSAWCCVPQPFTALAPMQDAWTITISSIYRVISGQLSASPPEVTRISPAFSSSPHFSDGALPSRPHRMPNTSPHYLTSWSTVKRLIFDIWEIQAEGESGSDACGWGIRDAIPTAFSMSRNVNGYLKPFTSHWGHANETISQCLTMKLKLGTNTHFSTMSETKVPGIYRNSYAVVSFCAHRHLALQIRAWFL